MTDYHNTPALPGSSTADLLIPPSLQSAAAAAAAFARQSRAPATETAYARDERHFAEWCASHSLAPFPVQPAVLALYLAAHAEEFATATLQRRLAAILSGHRRRGFNADDVRKDPALAETWEGIKRAKGTASAGKAPLITEDIRRLVNNLPNTTIGKRSRALILIGFAATLRRGEIVALDLGDIVFHAGHLIVNVRRSKRDQYGEGLAKVIPAGADPVTDPVGNLKRWICAAGLRGPEAALFRSVDRLGRVGGRLSGQSVRLIVRDAVRRAAFAEGCSAKEAERQADAYSAHSLRSGWLTAAGLAGITDNAATAHSGHSHPGSARRYLHLGRLMAGHPSTKVGL